VAQWATVLGWAWTEPHSRQPGAAPRPPRRDQAAGAGGGFARASLVNADGGNDLEFLALQPRSHSAYEEQTIQRTLILDQHAVRAARGESRTH